MNRIGISTDDKRAMLRRAWGLAPATADTLLATLEKCLSDAQDLGNENLNSSSSNGHSSTSNLPGNNLATDAEVIRAWNALIDGFRNCRQYLQDCADYGLDAFTIQDAGSFPDPLPPAVDNPVTTGSQNKWIRICRIEDVDPAEVYGLAVGDNAIYVWMMAFSSRYLNASSNNIAVANDWSDAIVGRSGGYIW